MKWIGKFLGLLLAISLAVAVQAWVLNQTVWSATYLTTQMHDANLADTLANVLPDVAVQVTGESEETRLAMKEALTPAYLQGQLDTLTPQMLDYFRGTGQQPQLDLRDLEAGITNAGLPVPPKLKSFIETPTTLSAGKFDEILKAASARGAQALWLGPLVSLVLAALIFIVSPHRRWSVLAGSFALAAVLLGILGVLAYSPPQLIASALDTSVWKLLTPAVKPLTERVAQDQAHALWVSAAVSLGLAILLAAVHFLAKTFGRRHKKSKGQLPA